VGSDLLVDGVNMLFFVEFAVVHADKAQMGVFWRSRKVCQISHLFLLSSIAYAIAGRSLVSLIISLPVVALVVSDDELKEEGQLLRPELRLKKRSYSKTVP
jgi:hypothetical protein